MKLGVFLIALAVGVWNQDSKLFAHGLKAVSVSIVLAYLGGVIVGLIEGGPIAYEGFKSPLSSFAISALIGVTAGLSNMDDSGRRYLIGVAAAVQLALFPVWFGVATVIGLPSHEILFQRVFSFLVNLGTIAAGSIVAYALPQRTKSVTLDRFQML